MKSNQQINEHGTKRWYNDDSQLHQKDGPAVECPGGKNEYYVNGIKLTEIKFTKNNSKTV